MKIVAVTAGTGVPSSSRMLTDVITGKVKEINNGDIETMSTYELRDFAVLIAQANITGFASPELESVLDEVRGADLLIAVSPVYQGSYSGVFKSFFDLFDVDDLEGHKVILGMTGGSLRHSMVPEFLLKPLFSYLRANVSPTLLFADPNSWSDPQFTRRVERVVKETLENSTQKRKDTEFLDFETMLSEIK